MAKNWIHSSKRSCSAVGTSISQSTHSIPYRCNEAFYELRTPHWLLNKRRKKNTEPWMNNDSITRATIHENLLKPLKELRSFLHHWLQLILVPSSILLPQVFSQCRLHIFFLPYFSSSRNFFFLRSFYSKDMGLLSFYLLVFVTLLRTQGVSFQSKVKKEGPVVYTGQICLMFQVSSRRNEKFSVFQPKNHVVIFYMWSCCSSR